MPLAGVFKLRREESAPELDGIMVAAVPVPVVEVVEGEVLVGVTAVVKGLMEVEDVTIPFEERLVEEVPDETVEAPLAVLLLAGPIENEPVEA